MSRQKPTLFLVAFQFKIGLTRVAGHLKDTNRIQLVQTKRGEQVRHLLGRRLDYVQMWGKLIDQLEERTLRAKMGVRE